MLRRADCLIAYHLATVVDDTSRGITDVLRGGDLWHAIAPQVVLKRLLGVSPPRYGHLPLWRDGRGQRLSNREGAAGLGGWRRQGLDSAAVIGLLAASADLVPAGSRLSARELLEELTPGRFEALMRAAVFTKASGSRG